MNHFVKEKRKGEGEEYSTDEQRERERERQISSSLEKVEGSSKSEFGHCRHLY